MRFSPRLRPSLCAHPQKNIYCPQRHNSRVPTNRWLLSRVPFATFTSYTFLILPRISTAGSSFRTVSCSEDMSYYDNQQWPAAGQPSWEQQTPPARSGMLTRLRGRVGTCQLTDVAGASSAVPREDSTAFSTQIEGT